MKYSASQAAKIVGKSIPTITRAIKNGKISAVKLEGGGFEIDPSELHRIWPAVADTKRLPGDTLGREKADGTSVLQKEVDALHKQIEGLEGERERERAYMSDTIEDLRKRLDAESTERRALTAQLTDQREKALETPKLSWWRRLVG
jgi:excisionase family DNA binding protein